MQHHAPTRAFLARRTAEGKTKAEIIRSLSAYSPMAPLSHMSTSTGVRQAGFDLPVWSYQPGVCGGLDGLGGDAVALDDLPQLLAAANDHVMAGHQAFVAEAARPHP
jgi:hypothetical protein